MRRLTCSFFALAALAAAAAAPANAATITSNTTVNIVRPVSLTKLQDMDFGTLTFAGFTGTRSIALSRTGVVTCAIDIVCSGAPKQARFNAQGTNKLVVLLTYSGGSLTNGVDTIAFTANGPASLTMVNSGAPGLDFDVGGSLTVSAANAGGVYTGTMTVTADYQ